MSSNPGKSTPAGDWSARSSAPGEHLGEGSPQSLSTSLQRIGGRDERYGTLEIARYEKDDGRSLLLYSRQGKQDS